MQIELVVTTVLTLALALSQASPWSLPLSLYFCGVVQELREQLWLKWSLCCCGSCFRGRGQSRAVCVWLHKRLCTSSSKTKCQKVISMWLEFTFGFMLLFSFLIDMWNEASHLQGRHWVCGLLCVMCGGEVVVCVGCGLGWKSGKQRNALGNKY